MRKSELEKLVMTGKCDGKKVPGRPRTSYLTSLKKWLDPRANENTVIQASATWSPTETTTTVGLSRKYLELVKFFLLAYLSETVEGF